jgi:hypothetical protein
MCYDLEEKMIVILIILIIYTVFLNMTLLFFYKEYRLCKLELDLIKRTVAEAEAGKFITKTIDELETYE